MDRSGEGQERIQPPPKVITGEGEAGGGRNVLIHRPTHPLPLISLPEFYSPLYRGGGRGGRAPVTKGCRNLAPSPAPVLVNQLLREAPGSCADPCSLPSGAASNRRAWVRAAWGSPAGRERSCKFRETSRLASRVGLRVRSSLPWCR